MIYQLFRIPLWIVFVCFYRRLYFINKEVIPKKASVIFVANHSNGMVDPILIAALQWRSVYFWSRADDFKGRFLKWFLGAIHMMPIYRQSGGKKNMHKNEETFAKSRALLAKGKTLFIAPEGNCVVEKRLRGFKTGAARLAFKTMEENNWGLDLQIVPTGLNYTAHAQFRSDVYIRFGNVIHVADYKALYKEDVKAAINKLTEDMRVAVLEEMILVEEKNDDDLFEQLALIARNNLGRGFRPLFSHSNTVNHTEKQLAKAINTLEEQDKNTLRVSLDAYQKQLQAEGLTDLAVANKKHFSRFYLFLLAPMWGIATLIGLLPYRWARDLRNKVTPFLEFWASFALILGMMIWFAWGALLTLFAAFWVGAFALYVPLVLVLIQIIAFATQDYYKDWKFTRAKPSTELVELRNSVLEKQNKLY